MPEQAIPDRSKPEPEFPRAQNINIGRESDLAELAAIFSAQGKGKVSAEVSAELALDIVLNEIVEQARMATAATGSAVILARDGEMVCKASSGADAPELGTRLSSEFGLTAECMKTRRVQRCDDALNDPRADAEASRSLGVQSVVALPLLQNGDLVGVLEVFSARAEAFGKHDEDVLEALAERIVKNLQWASEPPGEQVAGEENSAPIEAMGASELEAYLSEAETGVGEAEARAVETIPGPDVGGENDSVQRHTESVIVPADSVIEAERVAKPAGGVTAENVVVPEVRVIESESTALNQERGIDPVTLALAAAVTVCALLLLVLLGLRIGSRKAWEARGQAQKTDSSAVQTGSGAPAPSSAASPQAGGPATVRDEKATTGVAPAATTANHPHEAVPADGTLLVYENGKEVFRLPPGGPKNAQSAVGIEPVELSPHTAEESLVKRVEPEYPAEARQQGIQGTVVLDVRIAQDGTVQDVKVVSGPSLLADAATAAVRQWRFKTQVPPREMQTRTTLNFRLPQ